MRAGSRKKIAVVITLILLAAVMTVGGTMAWFSSTAHAENVITIGNVKINLIDEYKPMANVMPNQSIKKRVAVENVGKNDVYVRLIVNRQWKDSSGNIKTNLNPEYIMLNELNPNDWVKGKDGNYYYQHILFAKDNPHTLQNEKITTDFMRNFYVDKKLDNDYCNMIGNIIVRAEAVQSDHFSKQLERNSKNQIVGWNNIKVE